MVSYVPLLPGLPLMTASAEYARIDLVSKEGVCLQVETDIKNGDISICLVFI